MEDPWEVRKKCQTTYVGVAAKMNQRGHRFATAENCKARIECLIRDNLKTKNMALLVPEADEAEHNERCQVLLTMLGSMLARASKVCAFI